MFAAKQGFYYKAVLGPVSSPYWVAVFDDFGPAGIDVGNNGGPLGNQDFCIVVGSDHLNGGSKRGNILRLDKYGNVVYEQKLDGAVNNLNKVITDGNQFAHVIGDTNENGTARPYVANFDNTGTLVWEKYIDNVTNGDFFDISYQDTASNGFNNIVVGRSNSTSISQYMAFGTYAAGTPGQLYDQERNTNTQFLYSIAKDLTSSSGSVFAAGVDTSSSTDDIKLIKIDNSYTPTNGVSISDGSVNLQKPSVQWQSNRIILSTRYAAGTYAGEPNILVFDNALSSTISQSRLGGGISTNGLLFASKQNDLFYATATQTNNTVWYGIFDYDGTSILEQYNFYFGTAGSDNTTVTDIAYSTGVSEPSVYIIGTTDYYGTQKGFVAKLPIYGAVPGSGTYGASGEIHLTTSSYMSITTSSLTVTSLSPTNASTGFSDSASTLTQSTSTNTFTLNEVP